MPRQLVIAERRIDDDGDTFVIAEIGHNHQGDMDTAKALFRAAKECGADAVKLQKRDNAHLFTRDMYDSPYDNRNSYGATYGEHRESLEFGLDAYRELQAFCAEIGIILFATAFDIPSADFLAGLDVPVFKIASGDLKNTPLLAHVAGLGKPMIISSGGGDMEDVVRAHDTIREINDQLCLMQCTSGYPSRFEDLNLRVIETYRERFPDTVIGYSGHENGIAMTVVAHVLGARVIEKHFTLDRTWKGTDQAMSLTPGGLRRMVRDLRRARTALGAAEKRALESEATPLKKQAKYIVAGRDLEAGHVLTPADLACRISRRPGLHPHQLADLVGRPTTRRLAADEVLSAADVGEA